jgi:hypothetical protein
VGGRGRPGPPRGGLPQHHLVGDSREGWVHSLRLQLSAYFKGTPAQAFDYSAVRPRGTPIKGFGGSAAGGDAATATALPCPALWAGQGSGSG